MAAKLITENVLDEKLREKINKNADRLITLDDFDPSAREQITSFTGRNSYNDSDLRNRIMALEANSVPKSSITPLLDGINTSMLAADVKKVLDTATNNSNTLKMLFGENPGKIQFRTKAEKISLSDLDSAVLLKIDAGYSLYQSSLPDSSAADMTSLDAPTIMNKFKNLEQSKANVTDLSLYRKKSETINLNDLATSIQSAVSEIPSIKTQILSKADKTAINSFREKTVPITKNDLDSETRTLVQKACDMASSMQSSINASIDQAKETLFTDLKYNVVGNYYPPYNSSSAIPEDGQVHSIFEKNGIFPVSYCYQIINDTKRGDDVYKVVDILHWMYYDGVGDKYDVTKGFSAADQQSICVANGIPKLTAAETSNQNWGVSYARFSLTDVCKWLNGKIATQASTISSQASTISSLQSSLSASNAKITALETRCATIESNYTALKTELNTVKKTLESLTTPPSTGTK